MKGPAIIVISRQTAKIWSSWPDWRWEQNLEEKNNLSGGRRTIGAYFENNDRGGERWILGAGSQTLFVCQALTKFSKNVGKLQKYPQKQRKKTASGGTFAKVTKKKLRFPGHIWCQALNFFLSPDQWQHILEEKKMTLGLLYCMRQLWY